MAAAQRSGRRYRLGLDPRHALCDPRLEPAAEKARHLHGLVQRLCRRSPIAGRNGDGIDHEAFLPHRADLDDGLRRGDAAGRCDPDEGGEGSLMKAAVVSRFGSRWSIDVRELLTPVPAAGQVLVRVRAATVNRTDCGELRHPLVERYLIAPGYPPRNVLGLDFAGEVEAIGTGVSLFKPGDKVFGMCPRGTSGAQAEYLCIAATSALAIMPKNTPSDAAPLCEGAWSASGSVDKFCKPGCKALIYGASGAIGIAAVQLARYRGAHVTAVVA